MGLRKKVPLASVTLNHLLAGRGGPTLGYWFWREHSRIWVLTLPFTAWES